MNKKQLILSIEQAQKVCNEMNKCTNKFILQDSINEMKEAINNTHCCETSTCDVCFNETSNNKNKGGYRYCNSCEKL